MQLKAKVSLDQLASVIMALSKEEREILEMKITGEESKFKKRVQEIKQKNKEPVLHDGILCHPDFQKEMESLQEDFCQKIRETLADSRGNFVSDHQPDEDEFKNVFILDFLYGKKSRQLFVMLDNNQVVALMLREEGVLTRF